MLTAIIATGLSFTCTPTHVWDGDGPVWCAEGPKLRLAGIAAREIDETCKPKHPCPTATGRAARDGLVRLLGGAKGAASAGHLLVRGPTMTCRSQGSAGGSRTAASCVAPGVGDLSCAMVREGLAVRWRRYWGDHQCR